MPAQKPCVVNVLPSLQFERGENPCSRAKRNKIGIERSEDMTNWWNPLRLDTLEFQPGEFSKTHTTVPGTLVNHGFFCNYFFQRKYKIILFHSIFYFEVPLLVRELWTKKYVSKFKGRRNGRKPLPHNDYFSFFRYLLTFPRSIQGRIMINLFLSRSFFLVYEYIHKKINIRRNAGVIENSLRHDGFCFLSSLLVSYDNLGRFSQHTLFIYFKYVI